MQTSDFYKVYGAQERQDQLLRISDSNILLIFGFGQDESGNGYNWRKNYGQVPSLASLKEDIYSLINSLTQENILTGYSWNGISVYLSVENQLNFKSFYDLCVMEDADPDVTLKLGEDSDGNPLYYTFTDLDTFGNFISGAAGHVRSCLAAGWAEKDAIDWDTLYSAL